MIETPERSQEELMKVCVIALAALNVYADGFSDGGRLAKAIVSATSDINNMAANQGVVLQAMLAYKNIVDAMESDRL